MNLPSADQRGRISFELSVVSSRGAPPAAETTKMCECPSGLESKATCRGFVTVDRSAEPHTVTYTADYFAIGHASRFVHPGAVRIDSNDLSKAGLETVAFKNTNGSIVLLVLNNAEMSQDFSVSWHGRNFTTSLSAGSVSTYQWH